MSLAGLVYSQMDVASVSVGTTATQLVVPSTTIQRKMGVLLYNAGDNPVFIGDAGVTTTTGYELGADKDLFLAFTGDQIYGIVASATEDVRVMELG